jgi:hypothetical protein
VAWCAVLSCLHAKCVVVVRSSGAPGPGLPPIITLCHKQVWACPPFALKQLELYVLLATADNRSQQQQTWHVQVVCIACHLLCTIH